MDALAFVEVKALAAQTHLLRTAADQVHLDALQRGLVVRGVLPRGQVEIGAELAVGARQQVQVEGGRHALRIVVGRVQQRR